MNKVCIKSFFAMVLTLTALGVVTPLQAITHHIKNESGNKIAVELELHGYFNPTGMSNEKCLKSWRTSCCKRTISGLEPQKTNSWFTKGCQLKKIFVSEWDANGNVVNRASVNVTNASATIAKQVAAGALIALVILAAISGDGNAFDIYATTTITSDLASTDYTTTENLAYGSTAWVYRDGKIIPVAGVKVYKRN